MLAAQEGLLNKRNEKGQTALHVAIQKRDYPLAVQLIEQGYDSTIPDNNGNLPLDLLSEAIIYSEIERELYRFVELTLPHYPQQRFPKKGSLLLFITARAGKQCLVEDLIGRGVAADAKIEDRGILNFVAGRNTEMTRYLIEQGADVNFGTPLGSAVFGRNLESIQLLLNAGADPLKLCHHRLPINMVEELIDRYEPITLEELDNCIAMFQLLDSKMEAGELKKKARKNLLPELIGLSAKAFYDHKRQVCLSRFSRVRELILQGYPLSDEDKDTYNELVKVSCFLEDLEIIAYLFSNASEDYRSKLFLTCMELAIAFNGSNLLEFIYRHDSCDASALRVGDEHDIPFKSAICFLGYGNLADREKLILKFIELGEDIYNPEILNGGTFLEFAAQHNFLALADEVLKRSPAMINAAIRVQYPKWRDCVYSIQFAIEAGHEEMAIFLIEKGADISVKSRKGKNLLHLACEQGMVNLVGLLIEKGVSPDEKYAADNFSNNRVIDAFCSNHVKEKFNEIAALLLARMTTFTPSHFSHAVQQSCNQEIFVRLIEKIDVSGIQTITPIQLLIQFSRCDLLPHIFERYGVRLLEVRDVEGRTPLMMAVMKSDQVVYDFLIQQGANQACKDYQGLTIKEYALVSDRNEILNIDLPEGLDLKEFRALREKLLREKEFSGLSEQFRKFQVGLYAVKLLSIFQTEKNVMVYIEKHRPKKQMNLIYDYEPQFIHDLCLFNLPPDNNWSREAWANLLSRYGKCLNQYIYFASKIESLLNRVPESFSEIENCYSQIGYYREEESPELACLFKQHKVPDRAFLRVLDHYQPKQEDRLPDIMIEGRDIKQDERYYLRKLPPNDPRGFVLGSYTNCCQYLGSAGEACAWHGMTSPYGGFYVLFKRAKAKDIEKVESCLRYINESENCEALLNHFRDKNQKKALREKIDGLRETELNEAEILNQLSAKYEAKLADYQQGEIVAQMWAWISQNNVLVCDSWERLRDEDNQYCEPFLKALANEVISKGVFQRVLLGLPVYTPRHITFEKVDHPEVPIDYEDYRDSKQQALVGERKELEAENERKFSDAAALIAHSSLLSEVDEELFYSKEKMRGLLNRLIGSSESIILLPVYDEKFETISDLKYAFLAFKKQFGKLIVPILKENKGWACLLIEHKQSGASHNEKFSSYHSMLDPDWNCYFVDSMGDNCLSTLRKCIREIYPKMGYVVSPAFHREAKYSGPAVVQFIQGVVNNKLQFKPIDDLKGLIDQQNSLLEQGIIERESRSSPARSHQ